MFVGVLSVVVQIPGARSLKDRRRVVKSFRDRVRARHSVSIAEVGDVESWQSATFGAAVVARDAAKCNEILDGVVSMAHQLRDALVADVRRELLSFSAGGSGLRRGIEQTSLDEEEPW